MKTLVGDGVGQLNHAAYGWLTPTLAFAFSYLGCLLGLLATARARQAAARASRGRWLALGAWAIGGTGIWVMHFMAMIGLTVDGSDINYDVAITLASWLIAILVVGAGLFIVGYGRPTAAKVITAGVFTGLGVAGMHYTGVSAMHMNASVSYSRTLVGLSIAIAVVAATVALWFTVTIRSGRWIAVAAAIMAVAVTGMHYTGMYAMNVHLNNGPADLTGISSLDFIPPIMVFVLLVIIVLSYALLTEVGGRDVPAPPVPLPNGAGRVRNGTAFPDGPDRGTHEPRQPQQRWPGPNSQTQNHEPPAWRSR